MLTEAALSTLVIVAVGAAIGLGLPAGDGQILTNSAAFTTHYASWSSAAGLAAKLNVFVYGSANLMASYGIPHNIALTIMGVFLVSFAATTMDSATRIQRYVVSELAQAYKLPVLAKPHPATLIAVCSAFILAFHNGVGLVEVKKGALSLWPLFGTVNQLMAAMALLVITVFLAWRKIPSFVTAIPLIFMVIITGWAMILNIGTYGLRVYVSDIYDNIREVALIVDVQDTTPPEWITEITDQFLTYGESFDYQLSATDLSGVESWSVNNTDLFTISSTGHLTSLGV